MLCAYHRDSIPSGLHVHIDIGNLGCPFDAHWVPRWFPFGYTLGTLDFQLGSIAMPMGYGFPLVFDCAPHGIPMGGTHCMPMRSPWGPQWDPLGFPHVIPIDGFHVMHMWCQFASRLVSPFRGFSAGNVFLIASLVASAPGQCGGAQPGMPCLGKHIVSIPPGMVFCVASIYQ